LPMSGHISLCHDLGGFTGNSPIENTDSVNHSIMQ
jgi:hypothetical protein